MQHGMTPGLRNPSRLFTRLLLACWGLWLTGCATSTHTDTTGLRPGKGTVLSMVRFGNDLEPQLPPTSLAMFIENESKTHGGQFSLQPMSILPGAASEFALRLDLPPGNYRITRLFGTAGKGATASQFDFSVRMPFSVVEQQVTYIGRLNVTNSARGNSPMPPTAQPPGPGFGDAARFSQGTPLVSTLIGTEDEGVALLKMWPDLGQQTMVMPTPQPLLLVGPDNQGNAESLFQTAGSLGGEYVKGAHLTTAEGANLKGKSRAAFARFIRLKRPRAFAIGPNDTFGVASTGRDVVARALTRCNAQQAKKGRTTCSLFAVDDTVVTVVDASAQRVGTPRGARPEISSPDRVGGPASLVIPAPRGTAR